MNSENEESGSSSAAAKCVKVPFFVINVITWVSGDKQAVLLIKMILIIQCAYKVNTDYILLLWKSLSVRTAIFWT